MDLRFTPEELKFRDEVRTFFRTALPEKFRQKMIREQRISADDLREWHRILDAKGWIAPHWPVEYGGTGWDAVRFYIFKEEMQAAPAPDPLGQNINLIGPVIIAVGSEEQKKRFLPKLRSLEYWFCQGFSEPGAGSDLASLKTTAVRKGDRYIVNGQKIWTSKAHKANWIFLLCRTDPGAKKHTGISFLLIDMKTPGITVRPIITLDGHHETNETFFDNVEVPAENLLGEENKGWGYTKFLLGNERAGVARVGLSKGRIARAKELAGMVMVDGKPLSENERFREKVAAIEIELKALELTCMRVIAESRKRTGTTQDPKSSIMKLKGADLQQASLELLMEVAGPLGLIRQTDYLAAAQGAEAVGPDWAATLVPNYFYGRAASIYGGSHEIQHNILSKAVLGL
jgi:alkylation response protein AidB-like acyl-CoA dehydrogenase